jgi:hypothetical protein
MPTHAARALTMIVLLHRGCIADDIGAVLSIAMVADNGTGRQASFIHDGIVT